MALRYEAIAAGKSRAAYFAFPWAHACTKLPAAAAGTSSCALGLPAWPPWPNATTGAIASAGARQSKQIEPIEGSALRARVRENRMAWQEYTNPWQERSVTLPRTLEPEVMDGE